MQPVMIVNFTPDSFSDGGLHFQRDYLQQKTNDYLRRGGRIFDLGFESTAPQNPSITLKEEQQRFAEHFFFWYQQILCQSSFFSNREVVLSFDTYKTEMIETILVELRKLSFQGKLWWNDVSGLLNDEVFTFFGRLSESEKKQWSYIACHSRVPQRALSGRHRDFIQTDGDITIDVCTFARTTRERWVKEGFSQSQLILDPCFGFAKSRQQNEELLKNLPKLIESVSVDQSWLFGISRKSFLRQTLSDRELDLQHIELLQTLWFERWWQQGLHKHRGTLYWRLHDPDLFWVWKALL